MGSDTQNSIDDATLQTAADRAAQRCDLLAMRSEHPDGLTRTFCSAAMKLAHEDLSNWMQQANLQVELDAVGNLIGHPGHAADREIFMIGSHLDTVVNAGRFDGMLGVVLGLAVAEVLHESKIQLPFDLHVAAFSEEEGVRFGFPFIGSRGIAGNFDPADFDRQDLAGVSMRDALSEFGCRSDEYLSASYRPRRLIGFMEAHLEQAVQLQNSANPVGSVTAIAGQTRATIFLEGVSGHAGTVPHDQRKDALAAAAKLILDIEELGQQTDGLYATIGKLTATPGLSNVICGKTELRLDLRHASDSVRNAAFKTIRLMLLELKRTRGVVGTVFDVEHSPAVPMDARLTKCLQSAITDYSGQDVPLVSGAGHDAMIMAQVAPSCMLFVRCRDGISHHPKEHVTPEDIAVALKVMVYALLNLANETTSAKAKLPLA